MKYNAKLFLDDLKEADTNKVGIKRKKNKKAYSDGDVKDAAEEMLVLAENERKYYEAKDAKGAAEFARKTYTRIYSEDIRRMAKEAEKLVVKDLLAEWKRERHI